jgi:hypothetical protein
LVSQADAAECRCSPLADAPALPARERAELAERPFQERELPLDPDGRTRAEAQARMELHLAAERPVS